MMNRVSKRKNIGILVTPHGTLERHHLDIESTVMWGKNNRKLGTPAWLTPNSLRKGTKVSFTILRSTSIEPFPIPGEVPAVESRVKTRQAMTEQYHKQTSMSISRDSVVVLIGLLTALVLVIVAFMVITAPMVWLEWKEQNAQENTAYLDINSDDSNHYTALVKES